MEKMVFGVGNYSSLTKDEAKSRLVHYPQRSGSVDRGAASQPSVLYRLGAVGKKSIDVTFGADSLNGQFVLSRLTDYLAAVERGEREGESLTAAIVITASVNQLILSDRVELKRAREHSQYWISIGSSQAGVECAPYVVLSEPTADERASACLLGVSAVLEQPARLARVKGEGWDETWLAECLRVEVGASGQLDLEYCNAVFQGIIGFLSHQGFLEGVDSSAESEDLHYFAPDQQSPQLAQSSGLFVSDISAGSWQSAGSRLGCIYDASNGQLLEEIRLTESGYVSAIRRAPEVVEGDLVAMLCLV